MDPMNPMNPEISGTNTFQPTAIAPQAQPDPTQNSSNFNPANEGATQPLPQSSQGTPDQTSLTPQTAQPGQATPQGPVSPIPTVITQAQAKKLLQNLPPNMTPAQAIQQLFATGHYIQGINDQQYNAQQIAQQTPYGQSLVGGDQGSQTQAPSTSFLDPTGGNQFTKDFEAPLIGASKGVLGFGAGVVGALGKLFGSTKTQQAAQNFEQKNTQSYGTGLQGALQEGGEALGSALPYVAAGAATGGIADALGGGMLAQSAVGAATQGATAYLGSGGSGKAAALGATLGAAAPGIGKYVLNPALDALSSTFGSGGSGAVDAANKIIQNAADYKGSIPTQLVGGAQDLTDLNPDVTARVNPALAQQLADVKGVDLDTLAKGDLTPADAQKIASSLPNTPDGNALERTFRSQMVDNFNAADPNFDPTNPQNGVGNKFEQLYTNARSQYQLYDKFASKIGLSANPSESDALDLIKNIKSLSSDPNGKVVLKGALQDWAKSTGVDLSSEAKAAAYVNNLPKYSRTVLKWALEGAGAVTGISALDWLKKIL